MAHLAAAALGYQVWWVTAIGQDDGQESPYNRWKKSLPQIMSWDRLDKWNYKTLDQIDEWVLETRHKYRDEVKVD